MSKHLVSLFLLNLDQLESFSNGNFLNRLGFVIHNALVRRNSIAGSARNIKAHYDVGNDFYSLWLDKSMTYSSALYCRTPMRSTKRSRTNMTASCASSTSRTPSVLEIGCGWGGFAERAAADASRCHRPHHLARPARIRHRAAEGRAPTSGWRIIANRKGMFDKIVSIEMFEAVGEHYWPQYFATVAERLKRGGRAVIQTITIRDDLFAGYRTRSDFIRHYVFPGGMLPSLARFREEAERAGLKFAGAFSFGKDYARTLREWSARMQDEEQRDHGAGP